MLLKTGRNRLWPPKEHNKCSFDSLQCKSGKKNPQGRNKGSRKLLYRKMVLESVTSF